ncbi:MAG TPA: ABC transporter permease [Acidobacteriaceae bacterium]|nr:ABC transporter permease [Acidobacteriaceae bacterium]
MGFVTRIRNLGRRDVVDAEIAAELRAHVEMAVEEAVRNGMSEQDARRAARLRFGNPVAVTEITMSADVALGIDGVWRDVKFALRQLRRSPGFAVTAMVTLALGIGANIVVFGVLNAVLLQPLPVKDPQQIVQIYHKEWMSGGPSFPAFEDYQQRNTTFSGMAAVYGLSSVGLAWNNSVREISGYDVTGNYFDLLGVQPEMGRFFHASDEQGPGSAPYVVISDALWRRTFNADPGVIGKTVTLSLHPFTIIGVTPRAFHGMERFFWPDYYVPMANEEQVEGWDFLHSRLYTPVAVIGRLKPGVTVQQAADNLNAIARELAKEYPATDRDQSARLIRPGLEGDNGQVIREFLWSVTVLALLVLLAACANLASLFAARAADRSRELALRVSLGASRRRLLRQMLTESVLVSLFGGAAGMACAASLLSLLSRWQPFGAGSEHLAIAVDTRVWLAGLPLSVISGIVFGILPARHAWRSRPLQAMKGGPVESAHLRRFAVRDLLLGAQIAICTLLVTASLVAVRGMERALHAPLGIEPHHAMVAQVDLGMVGIGGDAALVTQKKIIDAVESLPGVEAAGVVNFLPLSGSGMSGIPVYRPGTVDQSLGNEVLGTRVYPVSPDYLKAAGTPLLTGRNLTWHDDAHTPQVAIVNETFARKMFGNSPAVGQHFLLFGNLYDVVGVTEDGKYIDLNEDPTPAIYTSTAQMEQSSVALVVRSSLPARDLAAALQRTLTAIAPTAPLTIRTWNDALSNVLFPARAATAALGVMGLLAAMLAVTGIFGMAAYSVSRRMKELGIRVALGARRAQVLSAAVGRPMGLLALGSAIGLLAGLPASGLLGRMVYQADPRDPLVVGGAMATMTLLGALATLVPARRALRVDPSRLMREE